ncbi:MAG TPA: TraR/DksA C4-type zinc finger protein [Flavisolibacter sp.]|nr:TraR/DksA C4-type zinc finger protein [Flavisolibacter sp.]
MATKKQAPKKAVKAARPVKKAPAKPARTNGAKPVAAKKAAKPVAKKASPKKAAPIPKKAVKKAAPPKKIAKQAKPVKKLAPVPAKKLVSAPARKIPASPVKSSPEQVKIAQPVKKPVVAAPTPQEVKPAIKPLVQQAPPPRKEAPKPTKIVIPKTSTTKAVKYDPDFTRSVLDSPQQEQTGPTMRYSDAELVEFRDLIMKKLETAKKELAYLQGLITRKDEGDMEDGRYMTMEDGSMSMEREQLSQMASRQIQFIDHLEKALMRIENKTYGICRVTGKLIDKARLRAVPHATLSIEAKQMMNK